MCDRDIPLIKGININTLVGEVVKEDRVVVAVVTEAMHKQHACLGCIPRHLPSFGVQLDAVVRLVCTFKCRVCHGPCVRVSICRNKKWRFGESTSSLKPHKPLHFVSRCVLAAYLLTDVA